MDYEDQCLDCGRFSPHPPPSRLPADLAQERERAEAIVNREKRVESDFHAGLISHEIRLLRRRDAEEARAFGLPALAQSYADALGELERLREALRWYADSQHWRNNMAVEIEAARPAIYGDNDEQWKPDNGERARAALRTP